MTKWITLIVKIEEGKSPLTDLPDRLTTAVESLGNLGVKEVTHTYLLDENGLTEIEETLEQEALDFQAYLAETRPNAQVIRLHDRRS